MLPAYDYTNEDAQRHALSAYPETEMAWRARYDMLEDAYEHGLYSSSEAKAYHLFRAVDDAGDEVDITRRVFQAYRFIVDTDVRGFVGSGLTLEERAGPAATSRLAQAEAIWRRAMMPEHIRRDIRILATMGDYWYEAQLDEQGRAVLVAYDPRMVTSYYSPRDGRTLERVVFETSTLDEPRASGIGLQAADLIRTWRRELTATTITETINGQITRTWAHNLGCVPAVHLRWTAWLAPEHSLPAPHGVEHAVTRIDSFLTQVGAIANRHAHPTMVISGARIGSGSDLSLGRILSGLPPGGEAKYLEYGGDGIGAIRSVVADIMAHVRETAPEFLFADGGAAESGTARSYRASAFVAKIEEAREPNLSALARLLGMACARERKAPYVVEEDRLIIQAPPVIAPHVPTELAAVKSLVDMAAITRADVVRHGQRLGLLDRSLDPVAYSIEAQDERAATAAAFFVDPATGGGADPETDPETETDDEGAGA